MSEREFSNLHVVSHPLVQHKLTFMRKKATGSADFRRLLKEISMLMAYEVTREFPLKRTMIETPLGQWNAPVLAGKKLAIVSIMRAGGGILEGMLELMPSARVGHIGLYRDPKTLEAVQYYCKLPEDLHERDTVVVDPMLATGHSAAAALAIVQAKQPRSLKFVCLVAAPEGVEVLAKSYPDVPVYTAALDERLNEHGYIIPGLGDAGDRLYGTK